MGNSIDDFRYKEIELDYAQSLAYDAVKFFDSKKEGKPTCPLCKNTDINHILHKMYGFSIIECRCDFMYAFPRPTSEEQHDFYQFGRSNMLWHKVLEKTKNTRKNNYIKNIAPLI